MKHYALAVALALAPGIASAVTLGAGETITNPDDYFDSRLTGVEADFFGALLLSGTSTVIRSRPGFDGVEVVDDFFVGSATIDWEVSSSASGRTVFRFDLFGDNISDAGDNGAGLFSFSGFAGYDVQFGFASDRPDIEIFFPPVSRSGDGDTITIDPTVVLGSPLFEFAPGVMESFYFSTDAPSFSLGGDTASAEVILESFGAEALFFDRAPAPAMVPLPAPAFGLVIGLLGLGALRRRRSFSA
ncbi:hypothetical protein AB838_18775 [Rhodobacteraceae bacterium (ex Bugula neritina AB1)]|nr:hypothetical protein AB838_18775 [Rhodobacteraceae bacterium (ex Bugula neritina AB1)]